MRNSKYFIILIFIIVLSVGLIFLVKNQKKNIGIKPITNISLENSYPLAIDAMRKRTYPGSDITIEQTLNSGSNYNQYIVSYLSDALKIYGLLTVPKGEKPTNGWPVIIFNHGYIPPEQYKTTERYVAYVDSLARNGYIVFKSDYRGNGNSQGQIVVDTKDIKVAVIWGGVVGSYDDLINNWQHKVAYQPPPRELALRNSNRTNLIQKYGTPSNNPSFWQSIDPTYFLQDIATPLQLHQGLSDEEVPPFFSETLYDKLKALGKTVEYDTYPGADHNISGNSFNLAMERTIKFFDRYLKEK